MRKIFVLALLLLCPTAWAQAQAPTIHGRWRVTAVLTATSVPNAQVHEGFMKEEVWEVRQNGYTATLTSPNGTIEGGFVDHTPEFPSGVWRFELMVERFMNLPNLAAKFEVVMLKRSENVLSGGSTVTYYGNNSFGGPWWPAGLESWRYDATRLQ
jgi:hypothetical protein